MLQNICAGIFEIRINCAKSDFVNQFDYFSLVMMSTRPLNSSCLSCLRENTSLLNHSEGQGWLQFNLKANVLWFLLQEKCFPFLSVGERIIKVSFVLSSFQIPNRLELNLSHSAIHKRLSSKMMRGRGNFLETCQWLLFSCKLGKKFDNGRDFSM